MIVRTIIYHAGVQDESLNGWQGMLRQITDA